MSTTKLEIGKTYRLPVDSPQDTEILGYRLSTKQGELNWNQLDWSAWWIDGPQPPQPHLFNAGGQYFHVRCKLDPDFDGPDAKLGDARWYRVRCWWAGGNYKGRKVRSIGIGCDNGKLYWIVRTEPKP